MTGLTISHFRPSLPFRNGHLSTIYPHFFRKFPQLIYQRQRIDTPDGDFLDLDFLSQSSDKAVLIIHGLEGSSASSYVKGMAKTAIEHGYDAWALNLRGCSGTPNRLPIAYHSGKTDDLATTLKWLMPRYRHVSLIGFSLGGNLLLRYLGEEGADYPAKVQAAVAISVPCDLHSAASTLSAISNRLYLFNFMRSLRQKGLAKKKQFPELPFSIDEMKAARSFADFDELYTAPVHGFENAVDYWTKCSSKPVMLLIKCPTLLINARNDPFLSEECYPFEEAKNHPFFKLEVPDFGGHVGFAPSHLIPSTFWHESRTMSFLAEKT